ncbi:MAG: hypothetical protein KKE51_10155 [Gammaproteobacteria bacterium]|nr:hypothetical protein [Gammaproteobacteria bacterium]MBU1602984.1 hypothetical protein [Gammaproteobacteria bacterium]MBU2434076.1 hypothetical protein [Gammaproteobacteria bacterium]MBU2448819.1 hypothetical protein [Gammaproteobacteria bacterium]
MLVNLLKVLLLMLGAALIVGGSLTGLCGVLAKQGDIVLMGVLPAVFGVWMFIAIARTYKRPAKPDPAPTSAESAEAPPANPLPPEES